jgi:hypothetical protein
MKNELAPSIEELIHANLRGMYRMYKSEVLQKNS